MRWLGTAGVAIAVLTGLGGCTDSPSVRDQQTLERTSGVSGRTSSKPSPTQLLSTNAVTLTCADAGTGNAAGGPGDLVLGSVVLEGMATRAVAIPKAADVRVIVPEGLDWFFHKAPVWMKAGSGRVTLQIVDSGADAFAWVPSPIWTSEKAPDLRQWVARTVTFQGCPDRDVTYFGGILAADPNACLDLVVQTDIQPTNTKRVALAGGPCSD